MNTIIFEALSRYKKDENLPYTEYFSLGYFLTRELAIETINSAKQLLGFKDLDDENFHIASHILNDGVHNSDLDDTIVDNKVFKLWYGYDVDPIYSVGGPLGVFSKYEYAELAKEKYSTWDIFIVHGLENFGIDKITLDKRRWEEGFVKVYD